MANANRRQREREEHRREILGIAEQVFAEKGYYNAAVQEIAERAEFSVGYLYNLFQSKEDIFARLIQMRADEYFEEVGRRLAEQPEVLDKVRTAIQAKMDFFRQHLQFFRIFAHLVSGERAEGALAVPEGIHKQYQRYLGELAQVLAEGIKEGLFVEKDPMALAVCMEGMTNATIANWIHGGGEQGEAATPEIIEEVFLQGILPRGTR